MLLRAGLGVFAVALLLQLVPTGATTPTRPSPRPPRRYTLVHPDAALSTAERELLVDALEVMAGARSGPGERSEGGG
jgi:hypothetical protein